MTFTYTFDDRNQNGPDLTIEVEVEAGYAGTLEYPAVDAHIVIGDITDATNTTRTTLRLKSGPTSKTPQSRHWRLIDGRWIRK